MEGRLAPQHEAWLSWTAALPRRSPYARVESFTPGAHKTKVENGDEMIRILLAEDDTAMREYLARALERSGYAVVAVDRGTAALPLLESERFDLLLTDIVMPEMDGIELAQKAAAMVPGLRVMFITGFAAVTLKAGGAMPQARVLSKPFHLRDLVMEVDRLFEVGEANGLS
jgi:two-component system cell cycle response regulator CpdR